ncbi:PilT/PilU family type 4a pilus ATPase [Leptothermofonsia sichuanensis E412]|uniref:type IV pilus twitching motility protein PilT n=1 Tax=Leptothermofonsia sichuanensis TaxID=2917832 RepID=UPI001CA642BC|nr:PilT/PilU family type 4a pilus ATPase [Leptothermofonsia sichuanensis]QZZ20524.1 PilT/PilU family type 4a pilus ATPase [Leptothermofonsia sichuanensis E412]
MTATKASEDHTAFDASASIRFIIQDAYDRGATALYLQPGRPPFYRLTGKLLPQDHIAPLTPEQFRQYLQEVLNPKQLKYYLEHRKLDADARIPGFMQCRVNCGPTAQGTEAMSLNSIAIDGPGLEVQRQGTVRALVEDAFSQGASDIHLQVGEPPRFRIQGKMVRQESYGRITTRQFDDFLQEVLMPVQLEQFRARQELDTAILYEGLVRCRVNCAQSIMGGSMVLRLISLKVPTLDELGLPDILGYLAEDKQGLILVTGPVNSGKSTTLAAMLRHLNDTLPRKIVTIEDPIEYVHTSNQCLLTQREVGLHTQEFKDALRASLRQDPDVILIGEMRDRETVDTAIRAAMTGHLVLGTLHTKGAVNAFKRLLNFYTPEEQDTVRIQIVDALRAVIAQTLVPTVLGGRTAALEIMLNTDAIRDYLQKGNAEDIYLLMEEGSDGSQTMNQALFDLYEAGVINANDALTASLMPEDLHYMLKNHTRRSSRSGLMSSEYFSR